MEKAALMSKVAKALADGKFELAANSLEWVNEWPETMVPTINTLLEELKSKYRLKVTDEGDGICHYVPGREGCTWTFKLAVITVDSQVSEYDFDYYVSASTGPNLP